MKFKKLLCAALVATLSVAFVPQAYTYASTTKGVVLESDFSKTDSYAMVNYTSATAIEPVKDANYAVSFVAYIPQYNFTNYDGYFNFSARVEFDAADGLRLMTDPVVFHVGQGKDASFWGKLWDSEKQENVFAGNYVAVNEVDDLVKVSVRKLPVGSSLYSYDENQKLTAFTGALPEFVFAGMNLTFSAEQYDLDTKIGINSVSVTMNGNEIFKSNDKTTVDPVAIAGNNDVTPDEVSNEKFNTKALAVTKSKLTVNKGKKVTIGVTTAFANDTVTFKSSNKKIATVNKKGVVKGLKAGSAKVTVSANDTTKTVKITVK